MRCTIRVARAEDAAALREMNRAFNGVDTPEDMIRKSLRENAGEIVLIAYVRDRHAGFICGQIRRSMCYAAPEGEISELFVAEEYRRRGLASALIGRMEREFATRGIFEIMISTSPGNDAARALYALCGYEGGMECRYEKSMPIARLFSEK